MKIGDYYINKYHDHTLVIRIIDIDRSITDPGNSSIKVESVCPVLSPNIKTYSQITFDVFFSKIPDEDVPLILLGSI